MKSLALLMYLCMLWPALADQSQQFCLSLQPLINRELCTTVVLQTCGAAATLNATFGSDTVIPTTPFNSSDFRQCFDVPYLFGTCEMCLSFSSATFSPTSARLCPVLDVCSGAKLSGSCFTLGNDCSSSSCGSCLASSSCGWCHSQLRCIASMDSQPYCSSCNASWITDQGNCPAPPPPAPSSEGLAPSAKIAIGVLVPIGVLSAALVACFVVKRRKAARAPAVANTTIGGTSVALSGEADRDISVHSDRSISLTRPITGGPRSSEAHDSEDAHSTPLTAQISSDSLDPRYEPPTTV